MISTGQGCQKWFIITTIRIVHSSYWRLEHALAWVLAERILAKLLQICLRTGRIYLTAQYRLDEVPLSLFESGGMRDFFIRVHYRWAPFVNGGIGAAFRVPVNRDKLWVNPGHCSNLSRGRSSIQINLDQQQKYTRKKYTAKYIDHAGSRTGSWHKESSYEGGSLN